MTRPTIQYRFTKEWAARVPGEPNPWTHWRRYKTVKQAEQALKDLQKCQRYYFEFRVEPI